VIAASSTPFLVLDQCSNGQVEHDAPSSGR
jgi:hypothetical protein